MKKSLIYLGIGLFHAALFAQPFTSDPTFGNNGNAFCSFGPFQNILTRMVLQPDGKNLTAGTYRFQSSSDPY